MPATDNNGAVDTNGTGGQTVIDTNQPVDYPTGMITVVVRDAKAALKWYQQALDAELIFRHDDNEGRIMHSVLKSATGLVFGLEDHNPKHHVVAPVDEVDHTTADHSVPAKGATYVHVTLAKGTASADQMVERMREAGATVLKEVADMSYGHRTGQILDPYGVVWAFAHNIEPPSDNKPADHSPQHATTE